MKKVFNNNRCGAVGLSMVIFMTMIIVTVALGLGAVSFNEAINSQGVSKSATAFSYAMTGARDALQRIIKNRAYSETTWNDATSASNGSYKIKIDSTDCGTSLDGCARVRVDYAAGKNPTIITSEGVSGSYKRKVQVDALVDTNGAIVLTTLNEIKSAPIVSTAQSTLSLTSAIFNGWANPNGNTITGWFRYGLTQPTQCNDTFSGGTSTASGSVGTSSDRFPISFSSAGTTVVTGLTYYYCAIVSDGTTKYYGNVFAFVAK